MLKLVKLQSLATKCCKMRKIIALRNLQILYTTFGPKVVQIPLRTDKLN
jgi:hypothetical protein